MFHKAKSKVAIIGAGYVGASIAFSMSLQQTVSELVLIDVNKDKAYGEVMDINHGLSFLGQMNIYAGDYSDVKDCDVIVVTAGLARKPGETRMDLARKNAGIAKDICDNVMKYYNGGVVLVVSNPVDVLTYLFQRWTGLPHGRVMGTGTTLDSARFRFLLSQQFQIDVRNIHGYIIGEHGDTQLPAWSATHIAGKNVYDFCLDGGLLFSEQDKQRIASEVKTAGAEIIKHKGVTHYAIAVAVTSLVESLVKNQNTIRTVSTELTDVYGVSGVAMSMPSMINGEGVYDYLMLQLTPRERELFQQSGAAIRAIIDDLNLGL